MLPWSLKDISCNGASQHIEAITERSARVEYNCLHIPKNPDVMALLLTDDVDNEISCALEYCSINKRQFLCSMSQHV